MDARASPIGFGWDIPRMSLSFSIAIKLPEAVRKRTSFSAITLRMGSIADVSLPDPLALHIYHLPSRLIIESLL